MSDSRIHLMFEKHDTLCLWLTPVVNYVGVSARTDELNVYVHDLKQKLSYLLKTDVSIKTERVSSELVSVLMTVDSTQVKFSFSLHTPNAVIFSFNPLTVLSVTPNVSVDMLSRPKWFSATTTIREEDDARPEYAFDRQRIFFQSYSGYPRLAAAAALKRRFATASDSAAMLIQMEHELQLRDVLNPEASAASWLNLQLIPMIMKTTYVRMKELNR